MSWLNGAGSPRAFHSFYKGYEKAVSIISFNVLVDEDKILLSSFTESQHLKPSGGTGPDSSQPGLFTHAAISLPIQDAHRHCCGFRTVIPQHMQETPFPTPPCVYPYLFVHCKKIHHTLHLFLCVFQSRTCGCKAAEVSRHPITWRQKNKKPKSHRWKTQITVNALQLLLVQSQKADKISINIGGKIVQTGNKTGSCLFCSQETLLQIKGEERWMKSAEFKINLLKIWKGIYEFAPEIQV